METRPGAGYCWSTGAENEAFHAFKISTGSFVRKQASPVIAVTRRNEMAREKEGRKEVGGGGVTGGYYQL